MPATDIPMGSGRMDRSPGSRFRAPLGVHTVIYVGFTFQGPVKGIYRGRYIYIYIEIDRDREGVM